MVLRLNAKPVEHGTYKGKNPALVAVYRDDKCVRQERGRGSHSFSFSYAHDSRCQNTHPHSPRLINPSPNSIPHTITHDITNCYP